ncbi:hypothetical protein L8C07_05125 [Paenibacillus sp. CMAA1739]|uniref:hypothetical protein n=1 Tax=Paenibacillus ottowii TaxID=2315729 RepID=UPI002DBB8928|nr:hypothetical protein [Paenibacillus sp. CMAA1739]MEC4565318.1 hypothetical protein [Paenibacillus sp. CMAA1739]
MILVAIGGSKETDSSASDVIKFKYETYNNKKKRWDPHNGSADAKITGYVEENADSTFYIEGKSVAVVGGKTNESYDSTLSYSGRLKSVNPPKSGQGQGQISSGSTKLFYKDQSIGFVGSSVKTMFGNNTVIETGCTKVFVSS